MNKLIKKILKENEESIDDFFKPKNLKSREEKYENKIRDIYFSFFDQMNEPERTQAKKNFNIKFASFWDMPTTICNAINSGFEWINTPEIPDYWGRVYKKYKDKSLNL